MSYEDFQNYVKNSKESANTLYHNRVSLSKEFGIDVNVRRTEFLSKLREARSEPEPSIEEKIKSIPNKYGMSSKKYIEESKQNNKIKYALTKKINRIMEKEKQSPQDIINSNIAPEEKVKKLSRIIARQDKALKEYKRLLGVISEPDKQAPLQDILTLAHERGDLNYVMKVRSNLFTAHGYILMSEFAESDGRKLATKIINKGINSNVDVMNFIRYLNKMYDTDRKSRENYEDMNPNIIEKVAITIGSTVYYFDPYIDGHYQKFEDSQVYRELMYAISGQGRGAL
jgi:hypothetical protein